MSIRIAIISGPPGSGKSTIGSKLNAFDLDWIGLKVATDGKDLYYEEDARGEFDKWHWTVSPSAIVQLTKYFNKRLFVGISNTDSVIDARKDLNIAWIWLDVEPAVQRSRLANRKDNDFGKRTGEMARALSVLPKKGIEYVRVDANGSFEDTIRQVRSALRRVFSPPVFHEQVGFP